MGPDPREGTPKRWLLALIPLVAAAGALLALQGDRSHLLSIRLGSRMIRAEVARTPDALHQGLSGRSSLDDDRGMLFVFERPDTYCFWMKDMKFNLDIVWLDDTKRVVFIERDIAPDTYPNTLCPDRPARYVLEVNAGLSRRAGVQVGDRVSFSDP